MHLFQLREPRLKPLVPAMEGDLQGLHLLKQFLRIDFINVFGLLCLSAGSQQHPANFLEEYLEAAPTLGPVERQAP